MHVEISVIRWLGAPWYKDQPDNPYTRDFADLDALEIHCVEVSQADDVCEVNARASGRLLVNLHKSRKRRGEKLEQKVINKFENL